MKRPRGAASASMPILALAAIVLLFGAPRGLFAQTETQPAQAAPGAAQPAADQADDSDTISFNANRVESVIAKGSEKTVLIGGAVITTGSVEIKADRIEIAGEDYNDVVCSGSVTIHDESKGFLLRSASLTYKRDTQVGLAETGVVLEDSKNDVVLKGEWVRFDQKQSIVDARIGVRIVKKDFAVRAEFARYNRDTESLQLSGQPVAVTADGTIAADAIEGKTTSDSLAFTGRVSGTIATKKKEGTSP
jgi:lipopolysaccharide assembly outer membrane protein LptD (OstA)